MKLIQVVKRPTASRPLDPIDTSTPSGKKKLPY